MKMRHKILGAVCGLIVIAVLAASAGSRIKQGMLPPYATPSRFEIVFAKQLSAMEDVAEGNKTPDEVTQVLSEFAIHGAFVVNSYSHNGKAMLKLKGTSPEWKEAARAGAWFVAEPRIDRPVVNIWGGRMAAFEKKVRTASGAVKGCRLIVDLEYLRKKND